MATVSALTPKPDRQPRSKDLSADVDPQLPLIAKADPALYCQAESKRAPAASSMAVEQAGTAPGAWQ